MNPPDSARLDRTYRFILTSWMEHAQLFPAFLERVRDVTGNHPFWNPTPR